MTASATASPKAARSRQGTGRVLVVNQNRAQLKWLRKLLLPMTCDAEAREVLGPMPPDGEFDLWVVNYDDLAAGERAQLIQHCKVARSTRLLLLSNVGWREDFSALFGNRLLTNFLGNNGTADADELIITIQKILRQDIFGIEKYFVWGAQPQVYRELRSSSQKAALLERAEEYVKSLEVNSRLGELFCLVADELITNAVYNAPTDAQGRSRFSHLPRSQPVQLEPHEAATVTFCCDGRRLGISVTDPFGSLTPEQILGYLHRCFKMDADQISQSSGGAGLGLYSIFNSLNHFIVNIAPGKCTEMIGLLTVEGGYRDFASRNKSFNIFLQQPKP